ncbi:MAG TPA: hypothetical protein VFF55_08300 [Candidatus Deferrimicrobium sp.]|nr:hypothetical protein [Candidatus Deferrimicrobium sp.]
MEGTRPASGRVLDRGAVYAAMVGLGTAVTIAISFALVVAVQSLVFISAPVAGAIIGFYANHKSERWRPRWRLFANAGFAGFVTGLSLALMYVGIRLLFIYADSGYRPEPMGGQLDCAMGPDCYYARLVDEGEGASLAAEGIEDAAALEGAIWVELGQWLVILTGLSLAGALAAATWRAVRTPPAGSMPDL